MFRVKRRVWTYIAIIFPKFQTDKRDAFGYWLIKIEPF